MPPGQHRDWAEKARCPFFTSSLCTRTWAAAQGVSSADGHQAGADKIEEFLGWCDEVGVEVVTLWLLSTDNLSRPAAELDPLLRIIEETVTGLASRGTSANVQWNLEGGSVTDLSSNSSPSSTTAASRGRRRRYTSRSRR